ncbi:CaiB/BaiF CoA transferase family protein [Thalassobacillus hwangdonensis]|uniref:CaiB/BaiF CoA transferase family protein n=1 Tax=Thalassobacillus hwangdonensis TaxID=546108 RepID=A0ABW3L425_9BACI
MGKPLEDIRVLDFSRYIPGPYATLRLAEQGADVVLVEPANGEPSRTLSFQKDGQGLGFLVHNRMKRSIALDLKDDKDKEIAKELAMKADVIVESFRPGVMERMGLSYESLKQLHPSIIYCSISGYGQHTAGLRHLGSHDLNYMAVSGILSQLKDEQGKPVHPSIQLADYIGGLAASEKIMAALIQRFRTGKGAAIDLSLTDSLYSMMNMNRVIHDEAGYPRGIREISGEYVCYHIYETSDQRYVALAALEKKFWHAFCRLAGRSDWLDQQFAKAEKGSSIYEEVSAYFKRYPLSEWTEISVQVDCCLTPVLEMGELDQWPLLKARALQLEADGLNQIGTVFPSEKAGGEAPRHGDHGEQIIQEWLQTTKNHLHIRRE